MTDERWTDGDRRGMARALVLAELGRETSRPNPMVGCVLVKDDRIVGEGWHERPGEPHAEVHALRSAGEQARGATAYVTLEPCDHQGRTGPCTRALLDAGVERVVYAIDDPDPEAAGGAAALREAGVTVDRGLLDGWAATQNEVFLLNRRHGRPFVTLKLAQTLDGQLSTPRGADFITGELARTAVHRIRRLADAVLVGSQTVLDDDPELTVRHVEASHGQPRAVVLDARGRTPAEARVVVGSGRSEDDPRALVLTTDASPEDWRDALRRAGAEVEVVPEAGSDGCGVDLDAALEALHARDLQHVMVEGGAAVASSFVRLGLVDRLVLHIALTIVGPLGLPGVTNAATTDGAWSWHTVKVGHLDRDLEVVAVPSLPAAERRAQRGAVAATGEAR